MDYTYRKYSMQIKTTLILRWSYQTIKAQKECLNIRALIKEMPRTKKDLIFKRDLNKYHNLQDLLKVQKDLIQVYSTKYWKLRRRENKMNLDQTAKYLFALWCNPQLNIKVV